MKVSAIQLIDDAQVADLVTPAEALDHMRDVFLRTARKEAVNYPIVRESIGDSVFGVKSGACLERGLLGLKAGGYFPANAFQGNTRHQSVVLLFDTVTGMPKALVAGNLITKLRTAAAAALSIDLLAPSSAGTLAVIGAGAQAHAHIDAACAVRQFSSVKVWNRSVTAGRTLVEAVVSTGRSCALAESVEEAVHEADVVITLTSSTSPLIRSDWVKQGAHLACMGADTAGKQEVDDELVANARVFTDSVEQALTIGECQTGFRRKLFDRHHIVGVLGEILDRRVQARQSTKDITLFDGTGLAVQDLAMAQLISARSASPQLDRR